MPSTGWRGHRWPRDRAYARNTPRAAVPTVKMALRAAILRGIETRVFPSAGRSPRVARASRIPANAKTDKRAALTASRIDRDAWRNIKDEGRLSDLLLFGQGLAAWAAQFDPNSYATLLAAGAVGVHGIDRLLHFIDDKLLGLAPYTDRDKGTEPNDSRGDTRGAEDASGHGGSEESVPTSERQDAQWKLLRTLNTFRFLREHVAGHLRDEPELRYPYDESPDSVPWSWTWEPADEETAIVAQAWFSQFPNHELLRCGVAEAQRIHDRVAQHGRDQLRRLIERMRAANCDEGFPSIRAALATLPPGKKRADAEAALKKFKRATLALAKAVPDPAPRDPTPFGRPHQEFFVVGLIEKFVVAGRKYVEQCLPLIEKKRGSLQARRKKVARRFAIVAQYAFLASSNGRFRRFAELIAAVEVLSLRLQEDVAGLLEASKARRRASEEELQGDVRMMNAMIVESQVLKRWRAAFEREGSKRKARYYGRVIKSIVESENKQTAPWERGDVLPALSREGLITAKSRRKKIDAVTDACFLMQQVGLAVQIPFDYLLGDASRPPRPRGQSQSAIAHDGEPWIVNPLGAVMADPGPARESKPAQVQAGKRQPKLKVAGTSATPVGTARNSGKRNPGDIAKPKKRRPPSKRSLPKAAKKWPRA